MRRRPVRLSELSTLALVMAALASAPPAACQTVDLTAAPTAGQSAGRDAAQTVTASEDAEAVKRVLVDMWDAIEKGDLERYASHVHSDFTSFGETDPYLNEGKAYELRSVAGWIERSPGVHTEMHQPEVTVRGDVAWITYYWTDAVTDSDGVRSTSAGKSTRIFVKEGGRWLCIHGHYTLRP